jgi:hypothetical protein
MKYIFKQIDNISGRNAETTVEFSADSLTDILQHFEMFIRGSGFHPSGTLDFVDYDDPYTTPKFECAEEYYEDEENDTPYEFDNGPLTEEQLNQIKKTHEWTQTLRDDSEWPFPKQRPGDLNSDSTGPAVMDWTAAQLIRPPKMEDVCPICKIDMQTMSNHECWDSNCPKGKDAN